MKVLTMIWNIELSVGESNGKKNLVFNTLKKNLMRLKGKFCKSNGPTIMYGLECWVVDKK